MSVTLNDFTIKYGEVTAVDNMTASFPSGATGLLGVNGAGKSSLIKGLLGLVNISSGSASILGHDVSTQQKSIRQLIGYMPEDDCIIPGLTGLGMVQFAGELCGMTKEDARERAHEVLFLVGLGEARYRRVEAYSSGMRQRIKLAQALVHDPKLLFLDEPTSGMDPKGRQEMLDLIKTITSSVDMSIVLASHILTDVERTCDKIVIIHRGALAREGDIQGIKGKYSGSVTIRIDGEKDEFIKILKEKKCEIAPSGKNLLDVTLPENQDTDVILQAADTSGVKLRKMVPGIQSLEDVFVKLIKEDDHAHL
ncbi:MAG: ABC transporter ATP-binding protein [bacterium]